MVRNAITDPTTGLQAEVISGDDRNGIVVVTRPLKTFKNVTKFFTNSTYGIEMNQNVGFSGTPIPIHNGTDNAYWTASAISVSWTFNGTDQKHAGSYSIDATSTINNSVAQIAKGSSQDLTGHTEITGWIYLTKFAGTAGIILYGWNTSGGIIVGIEINIADHISTIELGTWQQFVIPLAELELTNETIDSIRIRTQKGTSVPNYYLDDIQIEEIGETIEFDIAPDVGEIGLFIVSM